MLQQWTFDRSSHGVKFASIEGLVSFTMGLVVSVAVTVHRLKRAGQAHFPGHVKPPQIDSGKASSCRGKMSQSRPVNGYC